MSAKDCIVFTNRTWSPFPDKKIIDPVKILVVLVYPFIILQGESKSQDNFTDYYTLCGPLITLMKEFIIKMKSR